MKKEDYLAGIAAVEAAQHELNLGDKPEVPDAPQKPDKPDAATPVSVPAEPTDKNPVEESKRDEPFKGWELLPEETRKSLQEKLEAAEKAAQLQAELQKRNQEFQNSQSRLAPTQQQLAKLQADHAKLQKQLKEHESRYQDSLSAEAKKKLEAYKQQYPEEFETFETLTSQAYQRADAADRRAEALERKMAEQEQRNKITEELRTLSQVHPDWREARFSQEFEVWRQNLDPYTKETIEPMLGSQRSRDAIFVLNQFKHDLAWARSQQAQNGQSSQQVDTAPSVKTPTPVADPDPSRRQTAPSKTAGQPMSEKKRAFLEASAAWEKNRGRF